MSVLFNPLKIRNKTLPNRFLAQAMEGNDGENGGQPSQRTISRYDDYARGDWGAVVIEATSITETSLARVNGLIINEKNLDSIKRLVESFKKNNDRALLLIQITHAGERCGSFSQKFTLTPGEVGKGTFGSKNEGAKYLSSDDIEKIKDQFVKGTLLAEKAGIDGIDFKMCHGYFGAEMLRPSNTRDDKWGGSLENRTRFLKEAIGEMKSGLRSADFILGSRISMYEGIRGGCGSAGPDEIVEDICEMLDVIRIMDGLGMDYINVSAGVPALNAIIGRPVDLSKPLVLHHLRYTKTVKDMVKKENRSIKVIGSAYSTFKDEAPAVMEEMLNKDYVDICGFGRQSFADPMTPKKIQNGEKVNWCLLCTGCSKLMIAQVNDGCIVYNDYYKEVNKGLKAQ